MNISRNNAVNTSKIGQDEQDLQDRNRAGPQRQGLTVWWWFVGQQSILFIL